MRRRVYYLLYFFLKPSAMALGGAVSWAWGHVHHWWRFRCPWCKSREIFLQGYQGYNSDEQYAYHQCNQCKGTSILLFNGRLIKATSKAEIEITD